MKPETEEKILVKHQVYLDEVIDALADPDFVVIKNPRLDKKKSNATLYDVYCETSQGRLLKVIGRLFEESGHFLVVTVLNEQDIDEDENALYEKEKEMIRYAREQER